MAKPRPVTGIDPDKRMAPNARRILAVRIDEVYSYEWAITDPARVTELHDMRIACKRLRYLLEIFDVAFTTDLEPYIDTVKQLQDILGDIHDCDVQVPMLRKHLDWLEAREAEAVTRLADAAPIPSPEAPSGRGRPSRRRIEEGMRAFRESLEASRRGDERIGIHTLIARRERERDELYALFIETWRRLKTERFRARLEQAVGLR
jgi:hypothetical protein